MRPVVVFLGWLCKATHRVYARRIAPRDGSGGALTVASLTSKHWQISIPEQLHQSQAQVRDIGNQRERHKQDQQKRPGGATQPGDGTLEAQTTEKQVKTERGVGIANLQMG